MSDCTVYIDEAGDLGFNRGTRWFVLSAVIVEKTDESQIRNTIKSIRSRLNVQEIHFRMNSFQRCVYIVKEISKEPFVYTNVIIDTTKLDPHSIASSLIAYNYACRMLLERVSWYLRDHKKTGDIVLSSRGTSRDGELIEYIKDKLLPYCQNEIVSSAFGKISAKQASSWDLLQLADVCATTMFHAFEVSEWGFCTPCYSKVLYHHLYNRNGKHYGYGIKYFSKDMEPDIKALKRKWPCQAE